jgi:ketosteroid isomerase-like protein
LLQVVFFICPVRTDRITMNILPRLAFILAFAVAQHVSAAPADLRAIESEISALDARRIAALINADTKALDEIYSDELVYVHSGGKIDSKKPYLALLTSGSLDYVSQQYDPPARVVVANPDSAFVTGKVTIELKSKTGQLSKRVLTTTTAYARTAAGWKVVLYQGTPVQP